MKKAFYLKVMLLLAAAIFIFAAGCAKKETVVESSTPVQQEVKKEAAAPLKTEVKPAPAAETKEVKPADAEERNVAAQTMAALADIHFDFDEDILRPADRTLLNAHADWLLKNREYQVRIEGNCDERGTEEYNLALGQRRADTAAKYLRDMGVDGKRISTISYGKERPVDPAHNEAAWAKNRNDHFVLSK